MKTFKVTVDGQAYTVQVEEVKDDSNPGSAGTAVDQAAKPEPQQAPVEPVGKAVIKDKKNDEAAGETPRISSGGGATVSAPMPGSVIEVKVNPGDSVKDGDVLLVLEAMKMENELTAPQAGMVSEVLVKKGDTVNSGDPLITIS